MSHCLLSWLPRREGRLFIVLFTAPMTAFHARIFVQGGNGLRPTSFSMESYPRFLAPSRRNNKENANFR